MNANAAAESFHSSIKVEYIYRQRFATRAEARLKIATWITNFLNTRRRHSGAGGLPPVEFERVINQKRAEARSRTHAAWTKTPRSQGIATPAVTPLLNQLKIRACTGS
ncbi:integrase core domain-containing protein [Streptomyces sp. NPDC059928]|uniref:integrase core domain-containing protein n=1 Tax=unclassified Streptomyces TaxID=2593676 RepID=UPI00364A6FD7